MSSPARSPFARPGFPAFFATQLLSAFNDNFFKNAVVIWISAHAGERVRALAGRDDQRSARACSSRRSSLLSATAGQLADRYEKTLIVRAVKLAEVAHLALAAYGFVSAALWPMLLRRCS